MQVKFTLAALCVAIWGSAASAAPTHSFVADAFLFGSVRGSFTGTEISDPGSLSLSELDSFEGEYIPFGGLPNDGFTFGLSDLLYFAWNYGPTLGAGTAEGISAQTGLSRFFRMGNGIGFVAGETHYMCEPPNFLPICGYVGTAPAQPEAPFFEPARVTTTNTMPTLVPLPATLLPLAGALLALGAIRRRARS